MSAWTLLTWISIVVLVAGSVGVFAWFLRDAWRLLRELDAQPPES